MKRKYAVLIIAVITLLLAPVRAEAQFSRLSFGKYGIESIGLESFTSVKGAVWLNVTNPEEGFTVSDVSGTVYKKGTPFLTGSTDSFSVPKGTEKCVISGRAGLCPGVSLWTVLSLIYFVPENYSVDISLKITMESGKSRVVTKKGLPVTTLLKLK